LELRQRALGRVGIGYARGALVGVLRRRRTVLLRTPVVGDAVVGDAVQPARERGIRGPAGTRGDHPLPDVLEQVVGERGVAQLAQQEAVEPGAVARVELFEGIRPPGRVRQHQRLVADVVSGLDARGGDIVHRRQVKRCRSAGKARGRAPPGRGAGADRHGVDVWPPIMSRANGRKGSPGLPMMEKTPVMLNDGGRGTVARRTLAHTTTTAAPEGGASGLADLLAGTLPTESRLVV